MTNPTERRARVVPLSGLLLVMLIAGACGSSVTPPEDPDDPTEPDEPPGELVLVLEEVLTGLDRPLALTAPPCAAPPCDERLFVAEQTGRIRIIAEGALLAEPFLDLSDRTTGTGERGLLGLAFHPDYAQNGRLFVNYTDSQGNTRLFEFTVSGDPDRADAGSGREILSLQQPFPNHNGGHLAFGPDGRLYMSTGDGGGAFDPQGHGQNVQTLHGGILRLDVGTPGEATIPPGNPFAGRPAEGREELWAWGLRNPWRFSFDPARGLLYIADVGQSAWEEVNVAPAAQGGLNYGWAFFEGPDCIEPTECDREELEPPVVAYPHPEGCSVIGGYVYRGALMPQLEGHYLYSDLCGRWIRSFLYHDGAATEEREWGPQAPGQVTSFGQDAAGELYLLTLGGGVYRLEPQGG